MADKPGVATSFSDHSFDNDGNLIATGSANTYVVKTGRRIRGYYKGLRLCVRIPVTNTSASTLDVDEAGALAIRKSGNAALAAGNLVAGHYYDFIYDDANDVLQVDETASSLTAGEGIVIVAGTISTTIKRRTIADITGGDTLVATDNARRVRVLTGTGTLAFTAAATLGDGWWSIIQNAGTGNVTLNPNGAETIDSVSDWVLYPGGTILVLGNGTDFTSTLLAPMTVTFDSNGTFTKPGCGEVFDIECWGAGGSGGRGTTNLAGGGGGGAGYNNRRLLRAEINTTEAISIGTGGAARTTNVAGANGGDTGFGASVAAYGGGGGQVTATAQGGGGGGSISAAVGNISGAPIDTTASGSSNHGAGGGNGHVSGGAGGNSHFGGGGGGGGDAATGGTGGITMFGGGGGGGGGDTTAGGNGGTSFYAGAGGAGATAAANAANGTQPGGGGGGSETGNSGAGGNGRVRIRVF